MITNALTLARLVGEVFEVLLDEGAVFLRVFFGLGLEQGGAFARGQSRESGLALSAATRAISATFPGPIPGPAIASRIRRGSGVGLGGVLAIASGLALTGNLPLLTGTAFLSA